MRNGKRSRAWMPAQTTSACRLSVREQPSGLAPVTPTRKPTADADYQREHRHDTAQKRPSPYATFKVSLVFDHVGDTDTLKPAIRSPNVHRKQNESVKSAQPPIAITVALCGRAHLTNHCQTPTRPLRHQRMVIAPRFTSATTTR